MDFKKLDKLADPLDVFPELQELHSWATLSTQLEILRGWTVLLPQSKEEVEAGEEPVREPMYQFIPQADEVRRYMLFCYAKTSPHGSMGDMEKRRQKSLDSAAVPRREQGLDGWRLFTNLTEPWAGKMIVELMREMRPRVYAIWLSDLMNLENLLAEQRAPVFGLEDDKKGAAYERKLKISASLPAMHERLGNYEKELFPEDSKVIDAATSAALATKPAFSGGWAESMATTVK